ncbi:zinc finger protein 236 [Labeo rohita]|uniref:zinc finger protein 236 n=1 Tax=Labeo rohita TaxID=84645 RepID=UPI0021E1FB1B|nr:zinc finger protein 236 [Labeo rohita]XP_050994352.1 zinc finger protein 236 [Labeo rohita]XP_050994354.1 zinc finger protein 236 [Labeo rohita]XP_050994355.1 zinc finger protein 236 [Labeo rohita]XP_050994356.1 zinc finger protein 236 [Labeo rohita]
MKRMLSISSQMPTQMQLSFLNKGGSDLHTGLSSAYSSKSSDGQWMKKNLIFEEEQEATVKTQCEDNNVNAKVLQNKKRNGNKRVYECHVCLKRFGAPSKLKRHCLIHTDQRPFQCSICFRGFRERSHLKVHLKTHTNPSSPDQRSQTNTQITTSSPVYLKQKNNGENQCSICLKIFAYPSKLARHILSHTDIRPFKCQMCLKSFQFRWHLQCHVKTHKKKGRKIIAGHLEQDRTVSSSNVEKPKEQDVHTSSQEGAEDSSTVHQDQNMVKESMVYQKMSGDCRDSDVYLQGTLLNEGDLDLRTGQSSAYTSQPEGECMVKKEEFEEEQEASVTTQSEDNDVNVKALQSKSRNRNKRVYECHVCLKRFGAPSKLKRHCLIHTNQRPFQCSICSSAFREHCHLKAHLRTHTNSSSPNAVMPAGKGILPVSKSSDRIGTFQRKQKNGYQCEICLKKFRFPSKLTRHLFVHFDVKAYTCTICRKSFKQANYLHKHLKVHTGKRNDNSRLCRVPQKHGHKSPTPGALKSTNNCTPDIGNVCLPQILDSSETKKHQKPECRGNLHRSVHLIESNSSTIEIKSSNAWKNTEEQITSPVYLKPKHKGVNQCSICLKNFAFPSKLARHILSHTDIRPFKCPMCVKSFQFRWHLQCHVKIHKKKGRNVIAGHSQQDCTVSFSNAGNSKLQDVQISSEDGVENSATVHQDQNTTMDSQKMSGDSSDSGVCLQVSFLNEGGSDLQTGQSSAHTSKHSEGQWMKQKQEFEEEQEASITALKPKHKGVNQCSICLKNFAFPSKLARHILSHTNIRPFKCHMCMKSFQFRWHLQCHVKIHKKKGRNIIAGHSQQDRAVSLSNAGNSKEQIVQISSQDGAEDSATVHQDQNMAMDSQKMCGDTSNSGVCLQVSLLNDGGSDLHTGQSSAHSSKHSEGQWIKQKQEFEEEQETSDTTQSEDNNVRTHTHYCKPDDGNVCLPQILDSSEMKKHEKLECQRAESQPPTEEQITTSSPIYLTRKHKGVNQCSICLKNFAFPSKLARHILSHTNIRPFKCHMCVKSFQFRWHLQCHVKIHKKKGQNIIAGHSQRDRTISLSNSGNSKEQDVQISSQDGAEDSATVRQDQNMAMGSQKRSGDSSDSSVCLQASLLNEGGSDIHTGQSSVLSSKPSEGQWIKQKEEFEEEQGSSVTTLKPKHKGVNQCSICLKNFAYPSKLARHILSHTDVRPFKCNLCVKSFQFRWHLQCHVKIHKKKAQNIIAGHSEQDRTVSFSNAGNSKEQDVHTSSQDGAEDSATVHQDQNMVKEDMAYQKISSACSDSDVYLRGTLLNEGDWNLHAGQSSAHSSKPSEGQWMEKKEEFEEEQEASVTTQSEDKDVRTHTHYCKPDNGNTSLPQILDSLEMIKLEKPECRRAESQLPTEDQIKTSSPVYLKRKHKGVNQCSICLKTFAYPSKLARHILSHTNIRPFKCHMCVKSFQFRWHLQCHVKIHKKKGRNLIDGPSQQDRTVFLSNAGNSKEQDVQISSQDGAEDSATVHQDQNMAMDSQKMSGDSSDSGVCLQVSLLNEGGSDLHTGQSSAHSSKHSEGQWMKQKQEFKEEQESSVTTLMHKHKGVNQCSICLKNFAYPSKLARHILSHTNIRPFKCHMCVKSFQFRWHLQCHVKIHKKKGRNIAGHSEQDRTVSFSNAGKSKKQDMQISSQDRAEDSATVHQKMSGDSRDSSAYLQVSLLNEGGSGIQTRQSNAYSSKLSVGQWMQENQVKEEQAASVTTQNEDTDVNAKVLQSENRTENKNKRVCGCPVCHKLFDDPSKLKRHCRIHTNQRPFQCSVCCHAFRERSHLKEHIRIHNIPVKRRTTSLQSYRNNSVPCRQASKLKTKFSPKKPTAQDDSKSTDKENSTMHQEQNTMIAENMASRKIIGDCSNSDAHLQDFLLNEGGLHLHTGQSSAYSSKTLEGQWMEENQESEELQDANVTTQSEDKDLNLKVMQSKNANGNKRVYECPVCSKQFGAPSKLKRHCLIHTNQRPFQCSICCRAFRERSHLKVHVRTHTNPVKRRITSLQSYRDNSVLRNQASKSKIKSYPNQLTAQNDTSSTDKQNSTVHQDQKMVTDNLASQKMSGGNSNIYLQDSLLNEGGLDLHTGQSSAYSSKPSEGHWMEENQESEEEQELCVTTHREDKDVNVKVLQSKNSNRNKRVYDCPVCHKRFAAPSKLKRHCLIHTNQRPFQCSICSSAFRERSHLKIHLRTHTNPVKRRRTSFQSYRDNSFPCTRASKSRLKLSSKQPVAQDDTRLTDKEKSTVDQDQNMVKENMASQK